MTVFLDSSALVKLVQTEVESNALVTYLDRRRELPTTASALAVVEVVRAIPRHLAGVARDVLGLVRLMPLDRPLLESAADLTTTQPLRSLDAIHCASAIRLGVELTALVTYDHRLATAAEELGLQVVSPA